MKCVIFAAAILATLIVAAPSRAEVNVVSSTEYYVVLGDTTSEVNKYINEYGPLKIVKRKDKDVRAWGTTGFRIEPKAKFLRQSDGCGIKDLVVTLTIKLTLPQLSELSKGRMPAKERKSLDAVFNKLLEHENGHIEIATQTANQIESELSQLRAATCPEVDTKWLETYKQLMEEGRLAHAKYDNITQHGLKQEVWRKTKGVVAKTAPPSPPCDPDRGCSSIQR